MPDNMKEKLREVPLEPGAAWNGPLRATAPILTDGVLVLRRSDTIPERANELPKTRPGQPSYSAEDVGEMWESVKQIEGLEEAELAGVRDINLVAVRQAGRSFATPHVAVFRREGKPPVYGDARRVRTLLWLTGSAGRRWKVFVEGVRSPIRFVSGADEVVGALAPLDPEKTDKALTLTAAGEREAGDGS